MNPIQIDVDLTGFQANAAQAPQHFRRTLDRFVGRAAHEFARAERTEAPKAFSTLTNSVTVQKNADADYSVTPMARYAAAVNNGGKPHSPPLLPLYLWLKYTKRVSDENELRKRAYGLRRFIAQNGTKPNPFANRALQKTESRLFQLLRDGVGESLRGALGS